MSDEKKTLQDMLAEMMSCIRKINKLQKEIDNLYGVRMYTGFIPGISNSGGGDVTVRRGIEEIEKALGKEARTSNYSVPTKELNHVGIRFCQYADDKTKVFVKAGKEPPKVVIVDEE